MTVAELPKYTGRTYEDVITYTLELQTEILECKARDESRNEWYRANTSKD